MGEAGFIFVGLSVFRFSIQTAALVFLFVELLLVVSAAELNRSKTPSYQPANRVSRYLRGLARGVPDHHRARLFLHTIYYPLGFINFFVMLFILLDLVATGIATWNWVWGLFFGLSAFAVIHYARSVLNLVGQEYQDTRGSSLLVAAGFAHLASLMFNRNASEGLDLLLDSLRMADSAFDNIGYRPIQLLDILASVEALAELDDPPLDDLARLSRSIESIPKRDSLPISFKEFLEKLKWPAGFRHVERERHPSIYDRLNVIAIITIAVVGVLAFVIPGSVQQATYPALSSAILQQAGNLVGLVVLFLGMFYSFRTLTYRVTPKIVRKYLTAQ